MAMRPNPMYALGRLPVGVMNKTEAAFDAYLGLLQLGGQVLWRKFEGIKLRLADNTFYTPDFFVMNAACQLVVYEVKGFMTDDGAVKIKVAADQYPIFQFNLARVRAKKDGGGFSITPVGPQ